MVSYLEESSTADGAQALGYDVTSSLNEADFASDEHADGNSRVQVTTAHVTERLSISQTNNIDSFHTCPSGASNCQVI